MGQYSESIVHSTLTWTTIMVVAIDKQKASWGLNKAQEGDQDIAKYKGRQGKGKESLHTHNPPLQTTNPTAWHP
jgi:hypothetical protein